MKRFPVIIGLIFAAIFTGCASGPRYSQYAPTLQQPKSDEGRIWFYRPSKMVGAAVQPQVRICTGSAEMSLRRAGAKLSSGLSDVGFFALGSIPQVGMPG